MRPRVIAIAAGSGVILFLIALSGYSAFLSLDGTPAWPPHTPFPDRIPFPSAAITRMTVQLSSPGGLSREIAASDWPTLYRALQSAKFYQASPGTMSADICAPRWPVLLFVEFADGTKFSAQTGYDLYWLDSVELSGVSTGGRYLASPGACRLCGPIVTAALK